jgi:hypothetical protein
MRKLVSLVVLAALAFGLSGCNGPESNPKPADQKGKEAPGTPKDGV